MGFRVNATNVRAYFAVQQEARNSSRTPTPEYGANRQSDFSAKSISARGSSVQANFLPTFSGALGQALALGGALSPGNESSFQGSGVYFAHLDSNITSNSEKAALLGSQDYKVFAHAIVGIGDRTEAVSNTEPKESQPLFVGSSLSPESLLTNDPSVSPSQADATQVRQTLLRISKDAVLANPAISESDLKTSVDDALGVGTSELFHLRLIDQNDGRTAIQISQVEVKDLNLDQQTILKTAAYNSLNNFEPSTVSVAYRSPDIESKISEIQDILGSYGTVAVAEFRDAIAKQPGDLESSIEKLKAVAANLNFSSQQTNNLDSIFNDLGQLDSAIRSSYDQNALSDDFSVSYSSGRYREAYTSADIEQVAQLTRRS